MTQVKRRRAWQTAVAAVARRVPLRILEQIGRFGSALAQDTLRWGLTDRVVVIPRGAGRGLRFTQSDPVPGYGVGTSERPVQAALERHLRPGAVVFDVGANVGFFTVISARLVGESGHVYAFEPEPANLACLRRNLEINGFRNVTVIDKAVGSHHGELDLHLSRHPGGHSLSSTGMSPDRRGQIRVGVVALDQLVAESAIRPPNLVKIDVEGTELDVLRGLRATLDRHGPTVLYEVDDGVRTDLERKDDELRALLVALGYGLCQLPASYRLQNWHVRHVLAQRRDADAPRLDARDVCDEPTG